MTKINTGNANREYKDRLFRFVFGAEENKAYLLSLCNAVSGTDYTDVDDIEITTLSDAIYIKMKNDISFLIDSQMTKMSSFFATFFQKKFLTLFTCYSLFIMT